MLHLPPTTGVFVALFTGFAVSTLSHAGPPNATGELACVAQATAQEFPVTVEGRTITVKVLSPPTETLAADPALLLTFATDRNQSLADRPYGLTADYFLCKGHRAASFDLPAHGERVDKFGGQIAGLRNAFVAGVDPFAMFVKDGTAVIGECIKRGLAKPGRIAVAGTSRGGYMALRLLAGDDRIAAGAGYAPVTDWSELTEFAADKTRGDVRDLQLVNFVKGMTGKHVYVAIGKTDARVSTQRCQEFVQALANANMDLGKPADLVDFHLTEDAGHSLSKPWYERGRKLLLDCTAPSP